MFKEVYVDDNGDGTWDVYWDGAGRSGYYVQNYEDYESAREEAQSIWDWILCSRMEECDYGEYEEGQRIHLFIPGHDDMEYIQEVGEVYARSAA